MGGRGIRTKEKETSKSAGWRREGGGEGWEDGEEEEVGGSGGRGSEGGRRGLSHVNG